jgi:hypothetical protein
MVVLNAPNNNMNFSKNLFFKVFVSGFFFQFCDVAEMVIIHKSL